MSLQSRVVVLGGGIAGCASALALAGRGVNVTLLEASNRLGGRFNSIKISGLNRQIDSTQNVIFRTYSRFLQLLATCEVRDVVKLQDSTMLPFLEVGEGRISTIHSGKLPPPNHLTTAFLNASFLGLVDKMAMQKAVKAIQSTTEEQRRELDDLTFLQWLEDNGQSKRAIARFWNPIIRLALNIDSAQASAASAIFLFNKAFFSQVDTFDVGCFTTDFTQAVSSALRRTLAAAGVEVHLSTSATSLFRESGKVTGVNTIDGFHAASTVIICTPITATARLLTGSTASLASHDVAERLAKLGNTSQIGIHAFHEGPVLPDGTPFVICCDEPLIQMLFDRSGELDDGERGGLPGHWISSPVSYADPYIDWADELIRNEYKRVIETAFPQSPALIDFRVVRINRATTALMAGSQRLRPNPLDAGEGVILGGDWINIDWPSTLEASTRSGLTAAATYLELNGVRDFTGWHHDDSWLDWPNSPNRGDKDWRVWK
ncbi:MAG: FAD-dependent oxidoreductase [Candidatus Thermoplasmatota archaeon]|nr:FAD-dependent oxidoreductase [Candidatus Thermoplasmatota archaeon]